MIYHIISGRDMMNLTVVFHFATIRFLIPFSLLLKFEVPTAFNHCLSTIFWDPCDCKNPYEDIESNCNPEDLYYT